MLQAGRAVLLDSGRRASLTNTQPLPVTMRAATRSGKRYADEAEAEAEAEAKDGEEEEDADR